MLVSKALNISSSESDSPARRLYLHRWNQGPGFETYEELVQDIFLAIWLALPSYRGNASLRAFLARIATNRSITHVTRAIRIPPSCELDDQIPATGDTPEGLVIAEDRSGKLLGAVRALPLKYRQTALLALEGLSPREIADALGITTNAVAVRMSRAKELLRVSIGDKS